MPDQLTIKIQKARKGEVVYTYKNKYGIEVDGAEKERGEIIINLDELCEI